MDGKQTTLHVTPETQTLVDALKKAEQDMSSAEQAKNDAVDAVEQFKELNAAAITAKTLTANQNAEFNALKDAVKEERYAFRVQQSLYEMAKYKAKKAGAIVIQRSIFKESDSPEIRALKEEIAAIKTGIQERVETLKQKKEDRRKLVESLDAEITNLLTENHADKDRIAKIRVQIGELDPSQKRKVSTSKDGDKTGRPGRRSRFAEKVLTLHSDFVKGDNPARNGSSAAKTIDAFRESENNQFVYEDAIAAGIPARDIVTLIEGGKILVSDD